MNPAISVPPQVVSIETAVMISILMFVLGFFSNLLAMRKMFVGRPEFELQKQHIAALKIEQTQEIKKYKNNQEQELEKYRKEKIQEHKDMRDSIESLCEAKRASCAPTIKAFNDLQQDVSELYKLMRESHGKIERLIGIVEEIKDRNR